MIAFDFYYILKEKPLEMDALLSRHNHYAILKLEFLLWVIIYTYLTRPYSNPLLFSNINLGSKKDLSQSLSRVGACTCVFLPSCSSSVMLPFAWIKGSGAFPRGFPTRLSHEAFPQCCPTCHRGWCAVIHGFAKSWTRLND